MVLSQNKGTEYRVHNIEILIIDPKSLTNLDKSHENLGVLLRLIQGLGFR